MTKIKRLIVKEVNNCKITRSGDNVCQYFTAFVLQSMDRYNRHPTSVDAKPELEVFDPEVSKLTMKPPHLH